MHSDRLWCKSPCHQLDRAHLPCFCSETFAAQQMWFGQFSAHAIKNKADWYVGLSSQMIKSCLQLERLKLLVFHGFFPAKQFSELFLAWKTHFWAAQLTLHKRMMRAKGEIRSCAYQTFSESIRESLKNSHFVFWCIAWHRISRNFFRRIAGFSRWFSSAKECQRSCWGCYAKLQRNSCLFASYGPETANNQNTWFFGHFVKNLNGCNFGFPCQISFVFGSPVSSWPYITVFMFAINVLDRCFPLHEFWTTFPKWVVFHPQTLVT